MRRLHALLIGIDCYLKPQVGDVDRSGFQRLGGCVHDVERTQKYLEGLPYQGGERLLRSVIRLTATAGADGQPREPEELPPAAPGEPAPGEPPVPLVAQPTYDNVIEAFRRLRDAIGKEGGGDLQGPDGDAQGEDVVYIHYSGHGARVDTWFPAERRQDEALVPCDFATGGQVLRDVELVWLIESLVETRKTKRRKLAVTVVLDSCHSGGMSREPGVVARNMDGGLIAEAPPPAGEPPASASRIGAPPEQLAALLQPGTSGRMREPEGYVLLAACRAQEKAFEAEFLTGVKNGALTHHWLEALRNPGPDAGFKALHDLVRRGVQRKFKNQTPLLQGLEGAGDRRIFGSQRVNARFDVPVLADPRGARLELGAGLAHGVGVGATFDIYRAPGQVEGDRPVGRAVAARVDHESCRAELEDGSLEGVRAAAAFARLTGGTTRLVGDVYLGRQPASTPPEEPLGAVWQEIEATGWLAEAAPEKADFRLAVAAGKYQIQDAAGDPLALRQPAIDVGEEGAVRKLVKRLIHLSRFQAIAGVAAADSVVAPRLKVRLAGRSPELATNFDPRDGDAAGSVAAFPDPGNAAIEPGEWAFLRIENASDGQLNVTVLVLAPDFSIYQLYPRREYFDTLARGESLTLPLKGILASGQRAGQARIKVFATVPSMGSTHFRWLLLPALDRDLGTSRYVPRNPFEKLLTQLAAEPSGSRRRAVLSLRKTELAWTVADEVLAVEARERNRDGEKT